MTDASEYSFPVEIDSIGRAPKRYAFEPDAEARERIAVRLSTPSVNALRGEMTVRAQGREIIVSGRVVADLVRECVASLEPTPEQIDEDFEVVFRRADASSAVSDDDDLDAPEPLDGDALDLGELLVQQLSLAMTPFPRKEGARSLAEDYGSGGDVSPFAVLRGEFGKNEPNQ